MTPPTLPLSPSARPASRAPLHAALEAATDALLQRQRPDGHWVGELEGDTLLDADRR